MEHLHSHEHSTATGIDNRKLGFWLFLASECMFFGSLLVAYVVYRGRSLAGPGPKELLDIPLTSISTFVLLMSSLAMVLAVAAVQRGDMRHTRLWLAVTALLGLTFLGFQAYEFTHFASLGLTLAANLFGTSFYVLTGFHGTHVLVGVIWLLSLLAYSYRGGVSKERFLDVEIAGLYWHFVDIVWIVIFTVVYLIEVVA